MKNHNPYTEEQKQTIIDHWYNWTIDEKKAYAKKIGKKYTTVNSKANWEKNKKIRLGKTGKYPININKKTPASQKVEIVHITKPTKQLAATITIGSIAIEIPTKTFKVNGIKIEW